MLAMRDGLTLVPAAADPAPGGTEDGAAAELARAQILLELAADWVWECDAALRLTRISAEFAASTGLPPQALLGRRLGDIAAMAARIEAGAAHRAAIEARRRFRDLVFSAAEGGAATVWLEIGGAPIVGRHGEFRGYHGIGRTVTAELEAELARKERDLRFQDLFEAASDWFWETDALACLTYISPNFERLYGLPVAEFIGRRLLQHATARVDPEMVQKARAAGLAREPLRDILYAHDLADGRRVWVRTSAIPFADRTGAHAGYWGVSKDVTAEIEAERRLRDSERQYRELFQTAADWYFESDANGYVRFLSDNYEAVNGFPAEQALGKRLYERPGVSFEPDMGRMVLEARRDNRGFRDFVYAQAYADGSKRWFKVSGTPILGPDGDYRGFRGVGAEITKAMEFEATAKLSQRRLDGAIAYVTQPFVVYDHEDRAIAFNPAFGTLHRVENNYGIISDGVTLAAVIDWELAVGFYATGPGEAVLDAETLLALHRQEGEHTYHLHDGRWMLVTYRRLPGDARVGLWSDVTAIKQEEKRRFRLEEQLHHSQRLEALGTLAGGVAHEINNALVPVLALTQRAARTLPPDSRERRNLDTALASTLRIRDLVKRILAFSRKEERHRESVDVAGVLREALQMLRATVPANIQLETAIEPAPPTIGDPNELHQVIVNLVTNAAQAIGAEMGTITMALASDPERRHLLLSVADTGCGMSEATRSRIFEPFFTTKPVGEGTGLGLSVAHGIVLDYGGTIEVESAPGRGTRFKIVLPAAPG
jgi:PAS domain S-box-containing protein